VKKRLNFNEKSILFELFSTMYEVCDLYEFFGCKTFLKNGSFFFIIFKNFTYFCQFLKFLF